MEITVREFRSEDTKDAIAIWNEVVDQGKAFPQLEDLGVEDGEAFFKEQSYTGIAVNENDEIVGLYILHPNNIGRCGHICNASYAVKKDIRGQHIGEKLVKDCIVIGKEKGYRILQFEVNGFLREVKILDKHFEVKADRRLKTDPKNPGHLGATLPGTICDIRIKEGDRVTKNMPLMVIEAMKMETTVISKVNGTVDKIYVKDGEEVNEDTLLVSFIIDMEEQPEEVHPELPEMDFTTLEKDEFKTVDVTEEENK